MDEYNNSAKRLLILVKGALAQPDNISTAQVWANVLGLDASNALEDPHDVLEKLGLVRTEINLVRSLMGETKFPPELYTPYLDRVRNVVTVGNISAPWSSYRSNLQAETIVVLGYCSEILKPEPAVSLAELQDVLDMVLKLRAEMEALSFSPGVKEFLLRQLHVIEIGIRDYPVSGVASIRNAFQKGAADMVSSSELPDDNPQDKGGYSKIAEAWKLFSKGAKAFVDTDRFATSLMQRIEQSGPLLDLLRESLGLK